MMNELLDILRREAQAAAQRQQPATLTVTSYNPEKHAVKGTIKPYGIESGWIPIGTAAVGDGFGVAIGPCVGDQFNLEFEGGDPNSARATHRLFSNDAKPPKVESGEVAIFSKFGHKISLTKDNKMVIEAKGDTKINVTEGKCDISTKGDTTLKTEGKLDIEAAGATTIKSSGALNVQGTGAVTVTGSPVNLVGA
jgi:hypothetical protein